MTKAQIYKDIMRAYAEDRKKSDALYARRRAELYESVPAIKDIDAQLTKAALSAARFMLEGGAEAEKLRHYMQKLIDDKNVLIKNAGYPLNFLTDVYACAACSDTGYIDGKRCACLVQRLISAYYKASNADGAILTENFDTFDLRFYSEETHENDISPYANMQAIYTACMEFTRTFGQNYSNLLFYGDTGLGKTFLCNCIAKELLDDGRSVLYVTAPQMFKKIEDLRFNRSEEDDNSHADLMYESELLIIDDLGSEFATIITTTELFSIINGRHLSRRPTVISTNLSPSDLQAHYSDRIASRLFGNYILMRFFGEDIRIKKKLKGLYKK